MLGSNPGPSAKKVKNMAIAENRHFNEVHKKKFHFASKCRKAKCFICHPEKLLKIPSRQTRRANDKLREFKK